MAYFLLQNNYIVFLIVVFHFSIFEIDLRFIFANYRCNASLWLHIQNICVIWLWKREPMADLHFTNKQADRLSHCSISTVGFKILSRIIFIKTPNEISGNLLIYLFIYLYIYLFVYYFMYFLFYYCLA